MNGWVTIGTKLDSKQLDKDLKDAERELNRFEKESEKLTTAKAKVEIDLQDYEKQKEKIKQSTDELLTKAQTEEQVETLLSMENKQLDQLNSKYSKQFNTVDEINKKLQENEHNMALSKKQVQELTSQLSKAKQLDNIEKSVDNIGNSIKKTARNVGRWVVSLFGVASAYAIVRQSMSTLSEYNEDLANKISNIRLVLATALEPVINRILSLVITLLNYLNYLTTAWFGLNLFARASELTTNKMAKDLKSGSKSAKEIKKQLAGFDEMNVLQDNTSSGGGGGGDSKTPKFDLPEAEIPEWLRWISKNGDLVKLILEGIAAALLMIKGHLSLIQGLGIFLIIDGVVRLIKDLKTYLEDKTWENFSKVLGDISEILLGFSLLVGITTPLGIILAIVSQLVYYISVLPKQIGNIINFIKDPSWDNFVRTLKGGIEMQGILGKVTGVLLDKLGLLQPQIKTTAEAEKELKKATEDLTSAQDSYVNSVDRAEDAQKRLNEAQEKTGLSGEELYNQVKNGTLDYINMNEQQREVYKAYINNQNAQADLKASTEELEKAKKKEIKASLENQLALSKEKGNYDEFKNSVVEAYKKGEISSKEARDLIGKSMSGMSEDTRKTFVQDLPDNIKKGLDPNKYDKNAKKLKTNLMNIFKDIGATIGVLLVEAIGGTLKSGINGIMGFIESKVNEMIGILNLFISAINVIPGVKLSRLSKIRLPRLAKGGVINQPGRGVMVGSAIAGERGQEGVIPLTDSQQMALLGEAIGKYITINANITNTMNGRVISRELQKIQDESNFAFNG